MRKLAFAMIAVAVQQLLLATPFRFEVCDNEKKSEIVELIADNLQTTDILVVFRRVSNDWGKTVFSSEDSDQFFLDFALNIYPSRLVAVLKNDDNNEHNDFVYFYPADLQDKQDGPGSITYTILPRKHYSPMDEDDDYVKLVLVNKQTNIWRNVALPQMLAFDQPRMKIFANDLENLSDNNFKAKYGISHFFEKRVYKICHRCLFKVDYTNALSFDGSSQKSASWASHLERVRKQNSIMDLNTCEVSEMTFLAYAIDQTGRCGTYEEAIKRNPDILRPVPEIKTELGRMLLDALTERFPEASKLFDLRKSPTTP